MQTDEGQVCSLQHLPNCAGENDTKIPRETFVTAYPHIKKTVFFLSSKPEYVFVRVICIQEHLCSPYFFTAPFLDFNYKRKIGGGVVTPVYSGELGKCFR
jgi:hypothetical protein